MIFLLQIDKAARKYDYIFVQELSLEDALLSTFCFFEFLRVPMLLVHRMDIIWKMESLEDARSSRTSY